MPDKPTPEELTYKTQLTAALKENIGDIKTIVNALVEFGKAAKVSGEESNTLVDALNKMGLSTEIFTQDLRKNFEVFLSENESFVESMTYEERKAYVERLKQLKEMLGKSKEFDDALLKAHIRKNEFELEMEKSKIKIMEASEKGFIAMMMARGEKLQSTLKEFVQSTFGTSSKVSDTLTKIISNAGIFAGVLATISLILDTYAESFEKQQQLMLRTGGYIGRGFVETIGEASNFRLELMRQAQAYMTLSESQETFNKFIEAGGLGLTQMAMAQQNAGLTMIEAQNNIRKAAISNMLHTKYLASAIFGTDDAFKEMLEMMTLFRTNIEIQSNEIFSALYIAGSSLQIGADPLLKFMVEIGQRAFMTGQDIRQSIDPMIKFGQLIKEATKNPQEIIATYEALGKLVSQFDIIKYMAIMRGPGDVLDKYMEALRTGPFTAFIRYSQELASQLGTTPEKRAVGLAFALPEFRNLGAMGVEISKAILKIDTSNIKNYENLVEALKQQGLTEQIARLGAEYVAIKDPQARLLDTIMRLSTTLFSILAKIVSYLMIIAKVGEREKRETMQLLNAISGQKLINDINTPTMTKIMVNA